MKIYDYHGKKNICGDYELLILSKCLKSLLRLAFGDGYITDTADFSRRYFFKFFLFFRKRY